MEHFLSHPYHALTVLCRPTNLRTLLLGKPTSLAPVADPELKTSLILDQLTSWIHKTANFARGFGKSCGARWPHSQSLDPPLLGSTWTLELIPFLPLCNHDTFLYVGTTVKAKKFKVALIEYICVQRGSSYYYHLVLSNRGEARNVIFFLY